MATELLSLGLTWVQIEAELVRRDLAEFVRRVWSIVEPGAALIWSWHLDAVCEHLAAVTRGELQNLVINIPPGHMKSLLVSVCWPAWEWLSRPEERTIFSSHSDDVILRDSVRCRLIVESDRYQRWVAALAGQGGGAPWGLARDQNAKSYFENTQRGFRQCVTVKGKVTGKRGDKLVCDDPVDVGDTIRGDPSRVAERMSEVLHWWDKVMSSRLNDKRTGRRVLIMQRVHTEDLAGVLAERAGWTVLCLPTEYDPTHPHAWGGDPRTAPGELLFPAMFPAEVVAGIKEELGAADYAAQHEQRPSPKGGQLFQRDWMRDRNRYRADPRDLAASCDEVAIFMDCAFKGKKSNDPVALHVWGRRGADRFLLDRVHGRMGIVASRQALRDLAAKWPEATAKLIEDKANGPAVVEELGAELQGIIAFNPDPFGDKYARAEVAALTMEAGNLHVPLNAPWASEVLEEWFGFPGRPHDEDVDCLSMMNLRWRPRRKRNIWDTLP